MKNLSEYINESIEPSDYRIDFLKHHSVLQSPEIIHVPFGNEIHNPDPEDETSKRKAYKRYPWIKYWQAFTENSNNHLKCTCCNRDIFVDINTDECHIFTNMYYSASEPLTVDDQQAIGGHFYRNLKDNSEGYMIAPICKTCNTEPSDTPMKIVIDNPFVTEEGAIIEK